MPITLLTGLPGAGKSLFAVYSIRQFANVRPVYVYGVDGLQPFPGWEPLEHPDQWELLPDGAFVVIDEAQKVWPSSRGGDPTPPVRALSEHRHRGFDFLLITQHPTMLHSYVRKLVGEHVHLVRAFGAKAARRFTWCEAYDDPQSTSTRDRGTESLWVYPSECFPLYKSATQHTVKRRIPVRLVVAALAALVAVIMIPIAYRTVTGLGDDAEVPAAPQSAQADSGTPAPTSGPVSASSPLVQGEAFASRFTPTVEGLPWSAPAYANLAPTTTPRIFCISSPDNCTCLSEQGTRWLVADGICRHIARYGVYDPFAEPEATQLDTQSG